MVRTVCYTVGLHGAGLSSVQYTFIASENVTTNTQLLQLLEARFGIRRSLLHVFNILCMSCGVAALSDLGF